MKFLVAGWNISHQNGVMPEVWSILGLREFRWLESTTWCCDEILMEIVKKYQMASVLPSMQFLAMQGQWILKREYQFCGLMFTKN